MQAEDLVDVGDCSTPSSHMRSAPAPPSSAGWKISFTTPGSSDSRALSMRAAPSSIAVWQSCPHACIRPSISLRNGTSACS